MASPGSRAKFCGWNTGDLPHGIDLRGQVFVIELNSKLVCGYPQHSRCGYSLLEPEEERWLPVPG